MGVYGVGVVETLPDTLSPRETISKRLVEFEEISNVAKTAGCTLLVFPEFSFTYMQALIEANQEKTKECGVLLPNPSKGEKGNDLFEELKSLATHDGDMMTAFNVSEVDSEGRLYNTTIVLSSEGNIEAFYRKQNVWFTKVFESPEENVCIFEKNGVTYGMLTCYDILHTEPSKSLRNSDPKPDIAIYPVASFGISGRAFSISQRLWSWKNSCTLLSSDLNPSNFSSSGAYSNGNALKTSQYAAFAKDDASLQLPENGRKTILVTAEIEIP
mmetsp:Transcript_7225/g.8284  ORF Transcript_7225/g.8284 Transcript_7225/m.8284 type:complete len:271 (+) Transcript_7225:219-1031(+)